MQKNPVAIMPPQIENLMKITRIEADIFHLIGNVYYGEISTRLAFNDRGFLSNYAAQRLDRERGLRYIIAQPVSVTNPENVERARALAIGDSFEYNN
jgi:hypothetical protein